MFGGLEAAEHIRLRNSLPQWDAGQLASHGYTPNPADKGAIRAVLAPVIHRGETHALLRDMSQAGALAYWFEKGPEVFVAESEGQIAGTYFFPALESTRRRLARFELRIRDSAGGIR